jgi:DNA-binding transcriptional ArsR family regulator
MAPTPRQNADPPSPPGAHILSLGRPDSLRVSPTAVREILERSLARKAAKLEPHELRTAITVALATDELVQAARRGGEPWQIDVREDVDDLSVRSGLTPSETEAALDLLSQTGVTHRLPAAEGTRVRLAEAVFAQQPVLARIDWQGVREFLTEGATRASVTAIVAVLRELARRSAEKYPDGTGSWVREPIAVLAAATLYQRASVMAAIRGLEQAGFIEADRPSGRTAAYRLLPAAFGEVPRSRRVAAVPAAGVRHQTRPPAIPNPTARRLGRQLNPAGAFAVVARINGSEIRLKAGARLDIPGGWNAELTVGEEGLPVLEITPPQD